MQKLPAAPEVEMKRRNVLFVSDDVAMRSTIRRGLGRFGFDVSWVNEDGAAYRAFDRGMPEAVIIDLEVSACDGLTLCREVVDRWPNLPVLVAAGPDRLGLVIGSIRVRACDFVRKPLELRELALALERAIQRARLRDIVRQLPERMDHARGRSGLLGNSATIRQVYEMIDQVGPSDTTVLITGESGTGKELVARAVHEASARKDGPFVAVNCAAVPANLLESELFGHVRGAFTDAHEPRPGLFAQAGGGTLLLDEIGELPHELQSKLLRVLQEKTMRPVGGDEELPVDVRIIAATNRNLDKEIAEGRFREDLFYRINVVTVHVPPLRERGQDILLLAQFFIDRARLRSGKGVAGMTGTAAQKLLDYEWPGNVRELENCVERAVALTMFERLTVEDLPERIVRVDSREPEVEVGDPRQMPSLEDLERNYIQRVLEAVGGNKTRAATVLGIDRRTLYRKLERMHQAQAI
jgi:DNA-binding NtrC family response regulator